MYFYFFISHEYHDAEGNYVWDDFSTVIYEPGETVDVADLEVITEVDGVEYEVEGVYLLDEEGENWDYENPVTEFTVEEDMDVLIVYVEAADEEGTAGSIENEGTTGSGDVSADDESPKTGDDFEPAPFIVLMAAAVAVMGAAMRKRHHN